MVVAVLCLVGERVESLFDEALPIGVRELLEGLAGLDVLLSDAVLLEPVCERWEASARGRGRPTIAMSLYVRLMVIKQRSGWGYETLVREVSDSLHLRRFCGLSLIASVPHESTVRKLARRLGPEIAGEKITDRVVSLADPVAHPIGKGKLGKRYEFGFVFQLAEITRTRSAALVAYCSRLQAESALRTRASCCPRPSASSRASNSNPAKSHWTAVSSPRPTITRCPTAECLSPGDNSPPHADHASDWPATASATRHGSAI